MAKKIMMTTTKHKQAAPAAAPAPKAPKAAAPLAEAKPAKAKRPAPLGDILRAAMAKTIMADGSGAMTTKTLAKLIGISEGYTADILAGRPSYISGRIFGLICDTLKLDQANLLAKKEAQNHATRKWTQAYNAKRAAKKDADSKAKADFDAAKTEINDKKTA